MDFKKDYYSILEIKSNARKEEIKAAYRRLAKLHHPDKDPGNSEAEAKFKSINEANEILSNEILWHEYDEFRKTEAEWRVNMENEKKEEKVRQTNRTTYTVKKTVRSEQRIYIRGEVVIKYCGDREFTLPSTYQNEIKYKITPTHVRVRIEESGIHSIKGVPLDYLRAYKESDLFSVPICQPVKCTIKTDEGDEYYELELLDIRIKNIRLSGITKHDGMTFGTLIGDLYAYSREVISKEVDEKVTEYFGPTGNVETKWESGYGYFRKEYYNSDGSVYWSNWFASIERVKTYAKNRPTSAVAASGCAEFWWLVPVLFLFFLAPQIFLVLLFPLLIGLFFSFLSGLFRLFKRLPSLLGLFFLLLIFASAIRSFSAWNSLVTKQDAPSYDTLSTTVSPQITDSIEGSSSTRKDTLISHFIGWTDYDANHFETTLSVLVSDVKNSTVEHNSLDISFTSNSLAPAYSSLLQQDGNSMELVYKAFDSIKKANKMDDVEFARVVVSCIQSIPYYLVVDKNCSDAYEDEFTRNYLANCNRDCCIGNQKYGVRSPAEFIGDLKGDCDTRALLLFQLFRHYGYNEALLTSQYYQHAVVALNLSRDIPTGLSMNINNRNYYLWETTSAGFDVGQIPASIRALDKWEVTPLNQTK
jgi:hypothetical protein